MQLAQNSVKRVFASEDPYYEEVEVTQKNGQTRVKRVWKEPPSEGLSANDTQVLKRVTRKAWRLDLLFSMCGLRVGWSAVIGILPVIGDVINLYMALKLVRLAQTVDEGLPAWVVSKMMTNIAIDFALGFTPVLGTIAGALYRANSRNSLILEHFLRKRAKQNVAKGLYLVDAAGKKKRPWYAWGRGGGKTGAAAVEETPGELEAQVLAGEELGEARHTPGQATTAPTMHSTAAPPASSGLPPSTSGQVSGSYS